MEQNTQKSSMILKYAKRRYDGGPEIELIRSIERKQVIAYLNKIHNQESAPVQAEIQQETAESLAPVIDKIEPQAVEPQAEVPVESVAAGKEAVKAARKSKVLHALVLGPVEICIGLVGLMTAALAIFTFRKVNNPQLLKQGQTLLADCGQTLQKGIWDTFTTPVRVLKAAVA